jgi:hypothetical protein
VEARDIDWPQYDQLKAQGHSGRHIAQAMGIAESTLRGALKRRHPTSSRPVQRPVQPFDTGAVHSVDTGAVQPFDTGPAQRLDRLEDEVLGLRRLMQSIIDRLEHPPVSTPVQITALPPYPSGKAVRWNLWILDAIRDDLAALAAERGVSPSQLVQELLWKALTDRQSSRP